KTLPRTAAKASREAFAPSVSVVSGLLLLFPLAAQHLAEPVVLPPPSREGVLAPHAGRAVSVLLECPLARRVRGAHLGHQLVEVQLAERVPRAQGHRLRRVPLAPRGLLADDDPGRAMRVEPVDRVYPGRADRHSSG